MARVRQVQMQSSVVMTGHGSPLDTVGRAASERPHGLSVFFPAYNDSGTIASLVIRAVQVAAR